MPQSHTWQPLRCAVRTPLGVDWKILSIRKEPMLSGTSYSKSSEHLASCWKLINLDVMRNKEAGSHQELNPDTSGLSHQYSAMAVVAQ